MKHRFNVIGPMPESCGTCDFAQDNAPDGRKFCTKQPVPGATLKRPPIMNYKPAHAAEVNWYRRALSEIEGMTAGGKGQSVVNLMAQHALAAPPTAAAQAVEGMRKALEGIKVVLSGAAPIDRGIALLHRDREEIERHLNALPAYEEATRG